VTSGPEVSPRAAAVSAHRGGSEAAPGGTYDAYRHAAGTGAEYVEFDVRRTMDGELVDYHDEQAASGQAVASLGYSRLCRLAGYEVPRVADVMRLIAGRAIGHVDLKETGEGALAAVELALDLLGAGNFVATTPADASVAAIRTRYPQASAALTVRATPAGPGERPGRPLERIRACRADWAAVDHRAASPALLAELRGAGIRVLVWTINGDAELTRWLAEPGVDVVVTDQPGRAITLRDRQRPSAG